MFRTLYVFVVLSLDRRRVLHFNVTAHPTADWTARQLVQAFPFETAPRYLVRDRDGIYGDAMRPAVSTSTSRRNSLTPLALAKRILRRVVGTLRRECLESRHRRQRPHARRIIANYLEYYHGSRTHLGLAKDAPDHQPTEATHHRPDQTPPNGEWPAQPILPRGSLKTRESE